MKTGQIEMWQCIDDALPELRALVGELRSDGEGARANRLREVTDALADSRATSAAEFRAEPEQPGRLAKELASSLRQVAEVAAEAGQAMRRTGLLPT